MAEADAPDRQDTQRSPAAPHPARSDAGQKTGPDDHDDASHDDDDADAGDSKDDTAEKSPAARRKNRARSIIIRLVFLALVIAGILAGLWYWYTHRNLVGTDDAYTDGRAIVIAPQVSGYVVELAVNDNQFVHKGDLLLRIDPRDYQAAVDKAAGNLAVAKGQLAGAIAGLARARVTFPAELQAAQGNLAIARGNAFRAETDYKRQHAISREATTQQSVDASTAALQQAQGQVQQAEAQVTQATPVPQNIDIASASADQITGQVKQAQADLDQANLNLGYTVIRAPQDGWVTRRNVEVGNYAQPGNTVMSLVSPQIWVTANYKEDQLDRMRPGQRVNLTVDAYPGLKLRGHVDSIQKGSGSRFSAFPAENATGNFVKIVQRIPVKIVIDSGLDPNLPLPLGLSVEPTVSVGDTQPAGKDPGQTQAQPTIHPAPGPAATPPPSR